MGSEVIQMKISLDWVKPEIWRRFTIGSCFTLDNFHDAIQVIMGWTNSHLYGFSINGIEYVPSNDDFEQESEDTKGVTLQSLKLKVKDKIRYVYDFGDNWEHTVLIEKISKSDIESLIPVCLDGARNCPPDDCGSIPGYEDMVEAMKKPKSKEAKELIEWLGEPYNSEKFNLEEINSIFQPKKKKQKIKKAGGLNK